LEHVTFLLLAKLFLAMPFHQGHDKDKAPIENKKGRVNSAPLPFQSENSQAPPRQYMRH